MNCKHEKKIFKILQILQNKKLFKIFLGITNIQNFGAVYKLTKANTTNYSKEEKLFKIFI